MALTRRHVAIAAFIAFVSWGFITHWAPILRYLGYAFTAGALAACFLFGSITLLSINTLPGIQSQCAVSQNAAFVAPEAWKEETGWLSAQSSYTKISLFPSSFVVSASIDELLEWVIRDFVSSWYKSINPSSPFTNEIDSLLRDAILSIKERITSQDFVEVAISRFVPIITNHLKDFYEAEHVVRGKKLNRSVTESEELDLAIAAKYKDGKLHPAASLSFSDTELTQQEYLRKLVVRLIPELVPDHITRSRATSVLIKEIVSCAVLAPIMKLLSDPDTWNQIMEAYGKSMLQDRKTVRKLRAALDQHASPAPKIPKVHTFPKLAPEDDERKFERFIRAIRQCNNLSEARRFRSEVASQLKRESMLAGQDQMYLRRLETGKRILDQRVGMLSAVGGSARSRNGRVEAQGRTTSRFANASITEILHDASGLSYFMEYMDRQKLMSLVQYWIVVDGFRNPLEDDTTEDNDAMGAPIQWTDSDRQDIAQIYESYLSKPEIMISPQAREIVKEFLKAGRNATPAQYSKARSTILRTQSAVLEVMREKHFPNFRKSDLFYKLLTSDDASHRTSNKAMPRPMRFPTVSSIEEAGGSSTSSRPMSRVHSEGPVIRRNASSNNDLKSRFRATEELGNNLPRRSLDVNTSGPLFDDDVEPERIGRSSISLDGDSVNGDGDGNQAEMVEAMEAALNNIMTATPQEDDKREPLFGSADSEPLFETDFETGRPSSEFRRIDSSVNEKDHGRPNLASLGLVNTSSRIGVFKDNDLFGDEDKFLEDEQDDPEEFVDGKEPEDEIHEAEPGDLGLAEAISALTNDIDKLVAQDSIVDTLTRKAELTNNVAELRILGKSKSSLQRELRRKELQRQQYIVQESDNSLYGRASVEIKNIMVGKDDDGQEFALYVIEVQRKAGEHMPAASWAVARRYSEFHDLHQRLRNHYPAVRSLDFPRRRLVMKLQRDFLHKRRLSLQQYLRELLLLPAVCRSRDLRAFLSQRPILSNNKEDKYNEDREDIVSRIYNSVTDGMDEFLGNIPVLDQLSVAGQNLISAATNQYNNTLAPSPQEDAQDNIDVASAREARAELEAFDNQSIEPFVKPISDLFVETFELNRSQNWLRGRAVVVVLHQLLGGTIERKVRETAKSLFSDNSLIKYISMLKNSMWPGGILQRDKKQRTASEKKASRREASLVLATLVPDLAGSVVGRANAQAAGRRILATMNNGRLNVHLAFRLLDEVVAVLFPEGASKRPI